MGKRRFAPLAFVVAALLLVAGSLVVARPGAAQDANGTPMAMDQIEHPAHIHAGTCDELGEVVYPLNALTPPNVMGTPTADMLASPVAELSGMIEEGEEIAAYSVTTVEASIETLLAEQHAINVHESPENIQNYIACGNITGTVTDAPLEITLSELNNSGFQGVARLVDNGDETTTVTVVLLEKDTMGTPVASPTS